MSVLAASDFPLSVGAHVAQAESELLFGREAELSTLQQALDAAGSHPQVVYVHGPAGVGKSALLRAMCRHVTAAGGEALLLDGSLSGGFPTAIIRAIQTLLGSGRPDVSGSPETLAADINARGRRGPVVLCIDHYEELVASDVWLRQQLIYRLGPGICTVLADRRSPEEAWPGDRAWRAVLRRLEVREFSREQALAFLEHLGVPDSAARGAALRLGGHTPSLLGVVADALMRLAGRLPHMAQVAHYPSQEDEGVASALLEQIVHPGSRRRTWRAGLGTADVDQLLAAASQLRAFDREILAAMIGPTAVTAGWGALTGLRVVFPQDGRHVLHESIRQSVERVVHQRRPWAERQWQRRALAHLLERLDSYGVSGDQGFAWVEAARLGLSVCGPFATALGAALDPAAQVERGVSEASAAEVMALADESSGRPRDGLERLRALLCGEAAAFQLLRDWTGALIAAGALVPALGTAVSTLAKDGDAAAHAVQRWAAQRGGRVGVLGPLLAQRGVRGAIPSLLYRLFLEFCGWDRIAALHVAADDRAVLESLGFRDDPSLGPRAAAMVLDLAAAGGHTGWLRQVSQPSVEEIVPHAQRRDAARDALLALHSETRLLETAAARHFRAVHGPAPLALVRAWVLDALATADLGRVPVPGRELLMRYYVQRAGSHEAIAEEMNLTRATYFRWHRQTLDRFADSLFS